MGGRATATAVLAAAVLLVAGCGGSSKSKQSGSAGSSPGVLSGEAQSAAAGDIPDNQVFLTYTNAPAGYSVSYPEGWARRGSGTDVTFQDKNNLIHITAGPAPAPTPASAAAELAREKRANTTVAAGKARVVSLKAGRAVKVTYSTTSAPNPVTGKRVTLVVDRYQYGHAGKLVTLDLGTPKGVDNVDAYRMISQSFRWR